MNVTPLGLQILPRYFTRPPEAFELEDLDRYDLVLALDRLVRWLGWLGQLGWLVVVVWRG